MFCTYYKTTWTMLMAFKHTLRNYPLSLLIIRCVKPYWGCTWIYFIIELSKPKIYKKPAAPWTPRTNKQIVNSTVLVKIVLNCSSLDKKEKNKWFVVMNLLKPRRGSEMYQIFKQLFSFKRLKTTVSDLR